MAVKKKRTYNPPKSNRSVDWTSLLVRFWIRFLFSLDGFVKRPTSALRVISLSLRRTLSTPHDTKFARLEFGAFYFAIEILIFYEFISLENLVIRAR